MHRFLHGTCANTRVAQIIVNGHGSPGSPRPNSNPGNEDSPDNNEHHGGFLCVHIDGLVENKAFVNDVTQCFSSTHPDNPPFQVDLVFGQCYTNKEGLCSENANVRVICLLKPGQTKTFGTFSQEHETAQNLSLWEHAKAKRAQREYQDEIHLLSKLADV